MIIDIHVHIFEEKMLPKKFLDSIYEHKKKIFPYEEFTKYEIDGKTEMLIREMDDSGVDISVCSPLDLSFLCQEDTEISVWNANEYVAEAQARYPDRIIGFFGIDPLRTGAVDLLEKGIKELNLKGVKIFPGYFYPTEERIDPFIQKIEELGVPILFHMGSDPHPFLVKYGDPRYIDDLLLKYPKLKIIAAHHARGWEQQLVQMMVYRPNQIWTDVAGLQYEYIFSQWHFLMQMRYSLDRIPDAVLFGSDWPMLKTALFPSEKEWVEVFKNMKLSQTMLDFGMRQFSEEEKMKILGTNAQILLNL